MSEERTSYRMRFVFWLDDMRPEQSNLITFITDELKPKRGFSKAIRDGLRLVQSLRQGDVSVLVELFPWVETHFSKAEPMDVTELVNEFRAMMQTGGNVSPRSVVNEDDLQLTVNKAESDGRAGENFLKSMFALQGDTFKSSVTDNAPAVPNGPKVMEVEQFDAPDFGDLSL